MTWHFIPENSLWQVTDESDQLVALVYFYKKGTEQREVIAYPNPWPSAFHGAGAWARDQSATLPLTRAQWVSRANAAFNNNLKKAWATLAVQEVPGISQCVAGNRVVASPHGPGLTGAQLDPGEWLVKSSGTLIAVTQSTHDAYYNGWPPTAGWGSNETVFSVSDQYGAVAARDHFEVSFKQAGISEDPCSDFVDAHYKTRNIGVTLKAGWPTIGDW
jgi:hypothetical protein